jgi:hypothetical protein
MSDTARVRAWRQRLKEEGRVAMTIWVKADTKARYDDLALTYHQSPSELAQQALDAWSPTRVLSTDTVTDTAQLQAMIEAKVEAITTPQLRAFQEHVAALVPALVQAALAQQGVTGTATVTGTDTVTETPAPAPASGRQRRQAPAPQAWPTAHKLSPMQAAELRGKRAAGVPHKVLMQEYGLSRATLYRYLKESPG